MSENFFNFLHLYMLPFGIFMLFISLRKRSLKGILFFIPIVISGFLLLGTLEIKNEIKEEKKEFENIVNCLPKKGKKKLVDTIYNQKFEKNLKKYKEVDFKE